jgi:hypothetical protein
VAGAAGTIWTSPHHASVEVVDRAGARVAHGRRVAGQSGLRSIRLASGTATLAGVIALADSRGRAEDVDMASPYAVDFECKVCGKLTSANRRTGKLNVHARPHYGDECSASGFVVLEPDDDFEPDQPVPFHNPDSVPYQCPGCGTATRANRRTGLLYSHSLPASTRTCPESASAVLLPEGGDAPRMEREQVQPPPAPPVRLARSTSSSVRALLGGLPTLGRRRRG